MHRSRGACAALGGYISTSYLSKYVYHLCATPNDRVTTMKRCLPV